MQGSNLVELCLRWLYCLFSIQGNYAACSWQLYSVFYMSLITFKNYPSPISAPCKNISLVALGIGQNNPSAQKAKIAENAQSHPLDGSLLAKL